MNPHEDPAVTAAEDEAVLRRLGYAQELRRDMGAFSNFAVSLSIICILVLFAPWFAVERRRFRRPPNLAVKE